MKEAANDVYIYLNGEMRSAQELLDLLFIASLQIGNLERACCILIEQREELKKELDRRTRIWLKP